MVCGSFKTTAKAVYDCEGYRSPTQADGQMLLVRGPPRLRDGLMRLLCAAALTAGCSGGSSASHAGETLEGGLNASSPGIALASRLNALIKQNHDAQCAACQPCGGFSPGSDICFGAEIDTYPQAKPGVVCQIVSEEHALTCLTRATTCDAVNQCRDTQKGESMACPKYAGPVPMMPTGC